MKIKIKSLKNLVEYFYLFFAILEFNTVYQQANSDKKAIIGFICVACGVVLLLLSIKMKPKVTMSNETIFYIITYYAISIIYLLIKVREDLYLSFMVRFLMFFPLTIFLCTIYEKEDRIELIRKYINLITGISIISLFFWIFGTQLELIKTNMIINAHWATDIKFEGYFGLSFVNKSQYSNIYGLIKKHVIRNVGIFCEAPMFSFCTVLALTFEVFIIKDLKLENRNSIRICAILILTTLSTLTTAGLLFLAIITFMYIYINYKKNRVLMFFCVICAITILSPYLLIAYKSKMEYSGTSRLSSLIVGFETFKLYPLLGEGYASTKVYESVWNDFYNTNAGQSNTFATLLSQFGLMMSFFYLYPIIRYIKFIIENKEISKLCIMIVFVLELFITWCQYKMLLLFFISCITSEIISTNNKKEARK